MSPAFSLMWALFFSLRFLRHQSPAAGPRAEITSPGSTKEEKVEQGSL